MASIAQAGVSAENKALLVFKGLILPCAEQPALKAKKGSVFNGAQRVFKSSFVSYSWDVQNRREVFY